ncbi:DUF7519 family protein [Natrarchaeobius chitinivorans]|uniref:Uncharacterized protein n=1 Tax=Natrarchaeobius chitinivorans TaxID=1679083 RepID=A0A3N6LYR5_NATCH|nr:hypothetical protein [Natrarchaeobius chitinivorans]RQG95988.1 hypothetical protein EA473_07360 [Natrarchaeobius chitinivorans]
MTVPASQDRSAEDEEPIDRSEHRFEERAEVDRRPTVVASSVATVAVGLCTVIVSTATAAGGAVTLLGGLLLAGGLLSRRARWRRLLVDIGSLTAFAGVVLSGLEGAAVEPTLVATVSLVVAWDLAGSAIDLGEQLGRDADTRRLEGVHAVSSALVGLIAMAVGYGTFTLARGGQPISALVLLLLAGTVATMALGVKRSWGGTR